MKPRPQMPEGEPFDRDEAIEALSSGNQAAMERMATDWRAAPEILFFLSQATSPAIRARVAGNPSTPDVADDLLLCDEAAEVRACLGRKIATRLPELSGPEFRQLRDAATAKLLALARDCEVQVRRALASAVAELDCVPREVVLILARDADALVSVPIVEFSPLLDDDDLIALIAEPPTALVLSAMARRAALSPDIVDRLVETGDAEILVSLLRNTSTQIRETTLDRIIDIAETVEELHAPLVARQELTEKLIVKLSRFVASSLIFELSMRNGVSDEVRQHLEAKLKSGPDPHVTEQPRDEDIAAAIRRQDEDGVIAMLARRADLREQSIRRVFSIGLAKAIVALSWKSNLPMEMAVALQMFPGRIARARRINATAKGEYPMPREELEWHLSTLGIG